MTASTFTMTRQANSVARISDGVCNYWTAQNSATVGDMQAVADAFLAGYDGEGVIEFDIYDAKDDQLLVCCTGKPDGAANCRFMA